MRWALAALLILLPSILVDAGEVSWPAPIANDLETNDPPNVGDHEVYSGNAVGGTWKAVNDCNAAGEALTYDTTARVWGCVVGLSTGGTVNSVQGDGDVLTSGAAVSIDTGAGLTSAVVGDVLTISINTDAITPAFIDDDANTPTAGYAVIVETGAASFDYSDLSAVYEAIDAAIVKSDEAETLSADWVNTANPWADNEVADDLTLAGGSIATTDIVLEEQGAGDPTVDGDIEWDTTTETLKIGDDGGATLEFFPLPHTTSATDITSGNLSLGNGTIAGGVSVVVTTDETESPTMNGQMYVADAATAANDTDYTLPTAVAGNSGCFYDNGAGGGGIIIDAAAGDDILLDGVSNGTAEAIDSPGVAGSGANGDSICLLAIDATTWVTLQRSGTWVPGGND